MKLTNKTYLLFTFLIISIVSAGISPACKFISGQENFLEICTTDGIKLISQEQDDNDSNKSSAPHESIKFECGFCVQSAHMSFTLQQKYVYDYDWAVSKNRFESFEVAFSRLVYERPFPTGPPYIL